MESSFTVPPSLKRMQEKADALRTEASSSMKASPRPDYPDDMGGSSTKVKMQVRSLQEDLDRRQATYIRRERDYRARIELLESELDKTRAERGGPMTSEEHMDKIKALHDNIQGHIGQVQDQTARILQEQERDLLRAFRARLFDVQTELEKEKTRAADGATLWIEKSRQLEKELDWAKEMADRLDRHNQSLTRENGRLKMQFKTQEDDREYLIRQLVAAKKDNARLRQELTRVKTEVDRLQREKEEVAADVAVTSMHAPTSARIGAGKIPPLTGTMGSARKGTAGTVVRSGEVDRYAEVIKRLKRLLEQERKSLRQVRASFAKELSNRTELEVFLRQCIEDVRKGIISRVESITGDGDGTLPPVRPPYTAGTPRLSEEASGSVAGEPMPLSAFSDEEREKVMELLLSQERVVSLLYSKTFPTTSERLSSREPGLSSALSGRPSTGPATVGGGVGSGPQI